MQTQASTHDPQNEAKEAGADGRGTGQRTQSAPRPLQQPNPTWQRECGVAPGVCAHVPGANAEQAMRTPRNSRDSEWERAMVHRNQTAKGWPRQSLCGAQFPAQNVRLGTYTPQCLPALFDAPLFSQHWRLLLPQLPLHPMQVIVSRHFLASLVACRPSLCTGERWQRQPSHPNTLTRVFCVCSQWLPGSQRHHWEESLLLVCGKQGQSGERPASRVVPGCVPFLASSLRRCVIVVAVVAPQVALAAAP